MAVSLALSQILSQDEEKDASIDAKDANCPYGWGTLVKSGAKYMVIEKPKYL